MTARSCMLLPVILLAGGCLKHNQQTSLPVEAYGITGTVHTTSADAADLPETVNRLADFINRTAESLDVGHPESDLARLNLSGTSNRLQLSPRSFAFLDLCRRYHEITDGAFDITTGGIAALWEQGIPSLDELNRAVEYSGMNYIDTADNGTAILIRPGVKISPGRAVRAYLLDLATVHARREFTGPLLIDLGTHARSFGEFTTNNTPRYPVVIPERLDGEAAGHLGFSAEKAVANLVLPHRRSLPEASEREYLIDTRTGYPALGTRQVVVTGPLAIKAHALAEALLVLGRERGESILDAFPDYEVMLVPDRMPLEIWMTPGFREQFIESERISDMMRTWHTGPTDAVRP